ncbi:MAG TPA: tetratricopeptide repeat protein [Bacteroidota bacterium]|nr:tetratricopeptide repeat protein [Bacteroidota bacterium]
MRLSPPRLKIAVAAVLVAAATFLLYSRCLKNDFIGWDDEFYVLASPYITPLTAPMVWSMFSHFSFMSWTPLTLLSHAVDYRLWGLDPRGHHLTSLVIHAANALWALLLSAMLLRIALLRRQEVPPDEPRRRRLGDAALAGGILSALLFAWHPLRLESVACVSSRKDLLSAFFAFPSLLLYLRYASREVPGRSLAAYGTSLLLFVLALMAKGSVMMLPALMLIIDMTICRLHWKDMGSWRALCAEKIPFFVVALAAAIVAYLSSGSGAGTVQMLRAKSDYSGWEIGMYNIAFYVVKTVVPANLAELYSYPKLIPFLAVGSITPAVTICAGILWWKGMRSGMYAWGAYVLALLPMAGFIPSTIQSISNRYAYFAVVPLMVLAGGGLAWLWGVARADLRRRLLAPALALSCVVLAILGARTAGQIGDWHDAETVWRHTITVSPFHPLAHNELGLALMEKKDYPGAIESFNHAISLYPRYAEAMCNMGGAYLLEGDTARAERTLRASLALAPGEYQTITNIGNVRLVERRFDEAAAMYRQSLSLNPNAATTTYDLGYALMMMGKSDEALAALRRATVLNPNYRDAYFLMGEVLSTREGSTEETIAAYRRAARLGHEQSQRILASRGLEW